MNKAERWCLASSSKNRGLQTQKYQKSWKLDDRFNAQLSYSNSQPCNGEINHNYVYNPIETNDFLYRPSRKNSFRSILQPQSTECQLKNWYVGPMQLRRFNCSRNDVLVHRYSRCNNIAVTSFLTLKVSVQLPATQGDLHSWSLFTLS